MTDPHKTKIDLIPAHGGYRELKSFQQAELVYDLLDYEDFLRQRGLTLWRKDDSMARSIRQLAYEKNRSYLTYRTNISFF